MVKRRRARVLLFGALALLAALLPAGLAAGSHSGSTVTNGDPSVVLLTLGGTDQVTWMSETQTISGKNNCTVPFGGSDLLDFTPVAGQLGFVKDGFGVKSSGDGSGEPCGRIEASDGEALSVSLGSDLDGYLMTAIDVDLELKFNASVDVIFKHEDVTVASVLGFTGSGGSDDGPDSGDGDNFRFFARPGGVENPVLFDEVVFDPSAGAISLEGGADGTETGMLASNNSSQFEVVKGFDGEITCNDTVEIEDEAVPGVSGVVTMFAMEFDPEGSDPLDWYIEECLLKPFNDSVSEDSIFFMPELEGTSGRYTITITAEDQTVTTDENGQITSLIMLYDPEGDSEPTVPLQPCEGQPILNSGAPGYEDFWTQENVGLLPAGETACYYDVSLMPTGENVGTEIW
ncbi:MAG: hypothetical protein ACRDVK_11625, partial [Acidimicrobiia bacterium]